MVNPVTVSGDAVPVAVAFVTAAGAGAVHVTLYEEIDIPAVVVGSRKATSIFPAAAFAATDCITGALRTAVGLPATDIVEVAVEDTPLGVLEVISALKARLVWQVLAESRVGVNVIRC